MNVASLLFAAGVGQLSVLAASALVPRELAWRTAFRDLPRLHRQLVWVYGGYVVLSIVALGTITLCNAAELAGGTGLARAFCAYAMVFWGVRLALQTVLDVRDHLRTWWLTLGYHTLTILFAFFTCVYGWAALFGASGAGR